MTALLVVPALVLLVYTATRSGGAPMVSVCLRCEKPLPSREAVKPGRPLVYCSENREISDALGYGPKSVPPEVTEARRLGLIGYRIERRAA